MTWKDKLEIGLKDDAPYRRDNLPPIQKTDDSEEQPEDSRSPEEPGARTEADHGVATVAGEVARARQRRREQRKGGGRSTC
jgi:hypothetical protein